ncbi:hypothetical protein ACFJIW_11975 [Tahibacter sp. UC22_41]|uniref:hypothetical protein n=1 Tax=Tahibacter sp. UC22_41 TaxID=3350178 RepID=UPI0036DB906C
MEPRSCKKCGHVNDASTWKPSEACPSCGVIYAKFGTQIAPVVQVLRVRRTDEHPDWFRRNRRSLVTHSLLGFSMLVVGFYIGQIYMQWKVIGAVSEAMGGVAKAMAGDASDEKPVWVPPAKVEALRSPITVSLMTKGFREQDFSEGRTITDAITFAVEFNNTGEKTIRAFDGALVFTDLLDNEILGAKVSISDPIAAGSALRWEGELDYNQFIDRHHRLRGQSVEDLRVQFRPGKFLYSDGTRWGQAN